MPRASSIPPVVIALLCATAAHAELQVQSVSPLPNSRTAAIHAPVSITFDAPVLRASITPASFRVFGRNSGRVEGSFQFSDGDRTVTLVHPVPMSSGEPVFVNLSHDIRAADATPLRSAGYAFAFFTRAAAAAMTLETIDVMSNRSAGAQTRIYGASACDLNGDEYLDLATINEVSADVRVFLNRADGTGLYQQPFLAPQPIGVESSPNEPADFNNDGHADLGVVSVNDDGVYVLLGAGDGTFSITAIPVGQQPHGIAILDADGDGDPDIVNSNNLTNNLSLLVNDGAGAFSAPLYFESGTDGEYGLAPGDMNGDGIMDVVVGARDGHEIVTMLGNGNGTFTASGPPQPSGGATWVVALGDLDDDGQLDAALANSSSGGGSTLIGNGNGRFQAPVIASNGNHTVASDLGDLDGDGDLDWVVSSFGGGFWRVYTNDGDGGLTFDRDIDAPSNPSCAVLLDFDNDRDLDLALSDEIADVVVLVANAGTPADVSTPLPGALALQAPSPNPFVDATVVRFRLERPGAVAIHVHDVGGRRVAAMETTVVAAGWHTWRFDGRDGAGDPLPSGLYFCTLTTAGGTRTVRMSRMR